MFKNRKKDILNGNIYEQILIITIPLTGSYLLQQLYQFADSIVLGRYVSVEAIAAVGGSSTQIINVLLNIITGIATGVMILVAQGYGRRDVDRISETVKTGMFVAVIFTGLLSLLSIVLAKPILILMNTPEEIISISLIYMIMYFIALVPYAIYMFGMSILRATGDTKISILFVFVIAISKIVFNILLTAIFKLGIWGVAISTFLSYLICAIIVLLILHRTVEVYQYDITNFGYDLETLKNIFKIGTPVAIQSSIFAITSLLVNTKINKFGTTTIAAYSSYNNVDNFYWSFSNAIGAAILTITGQNFGNKNLERVKKTLRSGIVIDILGTTLIALFCFFCGKYFFTLFTTDQQVISIADQLLKFTAPLYYFYILVEIVSGTIKGCGDSMNSMIIAMIGVCVFRIIYLFVYNITSPIDVIACYPLSWAFTSLLYLVYFLFNKKYRLRKSN